MRTTPKEANCFFFYDARLTVEQGQRFYLCIKRGRPALQNILQDNWVDASARSTVAMAT